MLTSTLLYLALALQPKIDIEIRDLKDGDTISKERTMRVAVISSQTVRNVEFYVNDDLRDSDTSTPYEFKIDPLNEADGNLKLTFAAYTSDGDSAKKSITVKIETESGKGAEFNVDAGNASLTNQKWDDAIYSARLALKAKPKYAPAQMLIARAYLGKGAYDKAQTYAEEVIGADSSNADAKELLGAINLRKAFSTFSSGNRADTLKVISASLKSAAMLRRQNLDSQVEKMGDITDENWQKWTDLNLKASRDSAVVKALAPRFEKKPNNASIGNRLLLAQLRTFDMVGANNTIRLMEKEGVLDAYGYALAGVDAALRDDDVRTDKMIGEAEANDPSDIGLKSAKAFIAIRRARSGTLQKVVTDLAGNESQRPQVSYYLNILQYTLGNFADADRAFQSAVLSDPAFSEMYVEKGNQSVAFMMSTGLNDADQKAYQKNLADAYFAAALESRPGDAQALAAYSLYGAAAGKTSDALKFADGCVRANPNYAAGQFVATAIYSTASQSYSAQAAKIRKDANGALDDNQRKQVAELERTSSELRDRADQTKKRAIELDSKNLGGRSVPSLNEAYLYLLRFGRTPVLTLPQ